MLRIVIVLLSFGVSVQAMAQGMNADWVAKWANARDYTLAVADAMSDSLYDFRPDYPAGVDGERPARTFGEQLVHLGGNVAWLSTSKLVDGERPSSADVDASDKAAVRAYLIDVFAHAEQVLAKLSFGDLDEEVPWFTGETISRRRVGLLLFDHVTHHRGQALVYLRLNGVFAPKYVGW